MTPEERGMKDVEQELKRIRGHPYALLRFSHHQSSGPKDPLLYRWL